jgi:hypothetical protein
VGALRQLCRTADYYNSERGDEAALGDRATGTPVAYIRRRGIRYQRAAAAKKYQQRKQQHTRHLSNVLFKPMLLAGAARGAALVSWVAPEAQQREATAEAAHHGVE